MVIVALETITHTYEVFDDCGNTATCDVIITLNDEEAPTITCPEPAIISVQLGNSCCRCILGNG